MQGSFERHVSSAIMLISQWSVSRVLLPGMFASATMLSADISKWDVSSLTNKVGMFASKTMFNVGIAKWDVSSVDDMTGMFTSATMSNGNIAE